jgi:hypothetical protein
MDLNEKIDYDLSNKIMARCLKVMEYVNMGHYYKDRKNPDKRIIGMNLIMIYKKQEILKKHGYL